ncbi:MAG: CCDC90 family protein [Magnetococcus sp. YQC-5]
MTVASITFDTLKYANRLKAVGVPDKQAEAMAEVQAEVFEKNLEALATKGDIAEIKSKLRELRLEVMAEMRLNRWMLALVVAATVLPALKALIG